MQKGIKEEIKNRIAFLEGRLDDPYYPASMKDKLQEDIDYLMRFQDAMFGY